MDIHKNARLTFHSRGTMVRRVLVTGRPGFRKAAGGHPFKSPIKTPHRRGMAFSLRIP